MSGRNGPAVAVADEPHQVLVDARPVADAPSAAPAGPRVTRREAWVALPEPYDGFEFRLWVSAPTRVWLAVAASDASSDDALRSLVLAHNGWRDEDGEPYPPADDPAFWQEIPTELAALTLKAAQLEQGRLGNSLAPTGRR